MSSRSFRLGGSVWLSDSCLQWKSMDPESVSDLDLLNPLCRKYSLVRRFFRFISGVGSDGVVSFFGHYSFARFVHEVLCGLVILFCGRSGADGFREWIR